MRPNSETGEFISEIQGWKGYVLIFVSFLFESIGRAIAVTRHYHVPFNVIAPDKAFF